jgi:hypothetical protein
VKPRVFALAFLLAATFPERAEAHQQAPPVTTAEIPGPTGSADAPGHGGNTARPIFFGLLAFAFLALSGLAAELHARKSPRSRKDAG